MQELIDDVFLSAFGTQTLASITDSARVPIDGPADLAFTSDSFVVDPIFFPGGDIGKLAVCGTVNDLAVSGASPLALSFSVIIEEGTAIADLRRIAESARDAAEQAGVQIVTGDTKVVNRGAADGVFVNTAGLGQMVSTRDLAPAAIRPGDRIVVSNSIGDHGAAIMVARGDLGLETDLISDCRPLNAPCLLLANKFDGLRVMRDATRGGVAAVLNEFAQVSGTAAVIDEGLLPLKAEVRGVSELLGLDPLFLANEGLFVAIIAPEQATEAVSALKQQSGCELAEIIGEIRVEPGGTLIMNALLGGQRLVDMPDGEQLPRIC